jgi:hypothetical protein
MHSQFLASFGLLAILAGSCSTDSNFSQGSAGVEAEGDSTPETMVVLGEKLVFDSPRSLINEAFVTILGTIEGEVTSTTASVRVEEVVSDQTPYIDTMSVTAPIPGEVIDINFLRSEWRPNLKASSRVLVFVAYGQGQWFVVGQQHSAYLVGDKLEGSSGSILDGRDVEATLADLRSQGDEQERIMAQWRDEMSSRDDLLASPLSKLLQLPPLDLSNTPAAAEQQAYTLLTAAVELQVLWCKQSPLDTEALSVADSCGELEPYNKAEMADGSFAAMFVVPGRPPVTPRIVPTDTCGTNECFMLVLDDKATAHALVPLSATAYKGTDGVPSAPVELPTESLPITTQLKATATTLGKTVAGESVVFVTLTDDGTKAAYATWCTGPVDNLDACNPSNAQQLLPITSGMLANLLIVPTACSDGCRVAIADAADLSRRATVAL